MRALAWCSLLAALGCGLDLPNGKLLCAADRECPPGMHCANDGRCWHDGDDPGDLGAWGDLGDFDDDGGDGGGCPPCEIPGPNGCVAAPVGTDPNGDCATGDPACKSQCDGHGQCVSTVGVVCNTSCLDLVSTTSVSIEPGGGELVVALCDDLRKCTGLMLTDCSGSYACEEPAAATSCATSCQNNDQCAVGFHCNPTFSMCTATMATGPCATDGDCAYGFCNAGACAQCGSETDCPNDTPACIGGFCQPQSSCAIDCLAEGLGDGCSGAFQCVASSVDVCLDPSRPNWDAMTGQCTCNITVATGDVTCGYGEVCSSYGNQDLVDAHCVGVASQECWGNEACAGNTPCNDNMCGPAGAGALCRDGTQCQSGSCAPSPGAGNRMTCM